MDNWFSKESLARVWKEIKAKKEEEGRGKSLPVGIDGVTANRFDEDLGRNLSEISRKLQQKEEDGTSRYRFAPFRRKTISSEPGKAREICIPRIRDQIVLRAVANQILSNICKLHPGFPATSPRSAVKKVIAAREAGGAHILRTDIAKYYPSIPHTPLLEKVMALGVDPLTMDMVFKCLKTPFRDTRLGKDADATPGRGVPVGASLSTVLAEFYLVGLEEQMQPEGAGLVRYVDDILLCAKSEQEIKQGGRWLIKELHARGLEISRGKTNFTTFRDGFEFLGFQFCGTKALVSEKKYLKWIQTYQGIGRRFIRKINEGDKLDEQKELLRQMVYEINREVSGECGMQVRYYSLADDLEPFRQLDRLIRQMAGGVFRRLGLRMDGDYRLESAYSWAWKYKSDFAGAAEESTSKFPEIRIADDPCIPNK